MANRQLTGFDEVEFKKCTEFGDGRLILAGVYALGKFIANFSANILRTSE